MVWFVLAACNYDLPNTIDSLFKTGSKGGDSEQVAPGILVKAAGGQLTSEAGAQVVIEVKLRTKPKSAVRIGFTSSDPNEGALNQSQLFFTAFNWNVTQSIIVSGVDDALADGNQVYSIKSSPAESNDDSYNGLIPPTIELMNSDDDTANVAVFPGSGLVTTEAGGQATFDIGLGSQPSADVTINITSLDTGEATVTPSVIVFTPVNWQTGQIVTVTGVDDAVQDGDQIFTIQTEPAISSDPNYNGLNPADVSVTNCDDDTPGIEVTPTSGLVTTESGGQATFEIVLTSEPTTNVTINVNSSNTDEGTVLPGSVVFTDGDWDTPQTITVTGVNDDFEDETVTYTINVQPAVSGDGDYNGLDGDDVSVDNTDNDTAGITVTPTSGLTTTEATGDTTFDVVLTTEPTANVTINIVSLNADEGTVSPGSLVFTAGDWDTNQTVTVTGVDDDIDDGDIGYTIDVQTATSSDGDYNGLDPDNVSITNTDNDTAGITITPPGGLTTTEAAGQDTFDVVLESEPTAAVTVNLASSDGTEGSIDLTSLIFTTGNWDSAQTVTITGIDDIATDGDENYTIDFTSIVSGDGKYNGMAVTAVTVTNTDDDIVLPGISLSATSGLVTDEGGGQDSFDIWLDTLPTASVTIGISSSDTLEATVSTASVVFTTGDWDTPQTITITGQPDSGRDGDAAITILTAAATSSDGDYNSMNPSDVSVTNLDMDRFIFVTSATMEANIGGSALAAITNADALCDADASNPNAGTYKAVLVNSSRVASATANAGDGQVDWVLAPNRSYYQDDGGTEIFTTDANGIFVFGAAINGSTDSDADYYWTGLATDWTTHANNCSDFTNNGGQGRRGRGDRTNDDLISQSNQDCDESYKLLCAEQ